MTITTHLIGISNPSIQSILILSSFYMQLQLLLHPGYSHLRSFCQEPGQNKMAETLPFIPKVTQECPGARRATETQLETPDFCGFYIKGVWEFAQRAPGARSHLSTGYPQVIHTREFGEFELPKPMV
jgi:hypothetical protein